MVIINKNIKKIIRILLQITAVGHFIEFAFAIYEDAYITATLALIFGVVELTGGFLLVDEIKVSKKIKTPELHRSCSLIQKDTVRKKLSNYK